MKGQDKESRTAILSGLIKTQKNAQQGQIKNLKTGPGAKKPENSRPKG